MRVVVIGGGAAGSTAAQFARKTSRRAEVILVNLERHTMYSRCGLPYAISGRILSFDDLIEFDEGWFRRAGIELKLGTEAFSIDTSKRTVAVRPVGEDGGEELNYDSLVIATGASPRMPPVEGALRSGAPLEGIHLLRTIEDGRAIADRAVRGARAVVVGAGLIGLEMAEALCARGVEVAMIEILPEILLASLDPDMAAAARELIEKSGVAMHCGHRAVAVLGEGRVRGVVIENVSTGERRELLADLLVFSTGASGNTGLAKNAGCEIGPTGNIKVNSRCETSVKGIYAAGDCTEYIDLITRAPVAVGMGTVATRQGIVAGTNAAGGAAEMPPGILNTRVSEAFGMQLAAVGPTEEQLRRAGIEPVAGKFTGSTLPSYFPGGKPLTVKVLAHPESGRLLAAQIVGMERVHMRINALAVAILAGVSVEEMARLETAYAPPIAPTLDPVTLACEAARRRLGRG
ncbi:MAG: FAD-dependent oxidoreductase [Thermoplasmata archaeon]